MKIFRRVKGIPEPVDTSDMTKSEKVAESVTFNEDGSYSSTVSGPVDDFWENLDKKKEAQKSGNQGGAENTDTVNNTEKNGAENQEKTE